MAEVKSKARKPKSEDATVIADYAISDLIGNLDRAAVQANLDPRQAPAIIALQDLIPSYQRLDLFEILPEQYWKKIEVLGPPDIEAEPGEQAANAAISYMVCNVCRNIYGDATGRIKDAERAERVMLDLFGDMAKVKAKVKAK